MEVTFLGGADEIGASCAAVDLEGVRFLVDCGQRMGALPGSALPDFSRLEGGPPIAAVLLTHAHADHIGALPALNSFLSPECPIYGTEATLALARVMLKDSQRIMAVHRQGDGELPLFPPAWVTAVTRRFSAVPWRQPVRIGSGDVQAAWYPAGHILGAAMIEIHGRFDSALFTGDISVSEQMSVPGVFVPAVRSRLLVMESTYGNRMHAHRPAQEKRLVDRVARCISERGRVLFPVFALGRAQEVLLVLGKAMREGRLPEVPIFADGLVRSISKVYSKFPNELSPWCRRLWEEGIDPFFPEDLPIRPIRDDPHRQQVARSGPCVVVASSGMLQGGASLFYAREWIGAAKNLIMLTGYQDEESPGQALLDLATSPPESPRYFKLDGVRTRVQCQIENCQLSAHADSGELISLASKLQPNLILPVHGDSEARESLAKVLMHACRAKVVLPSNGETYQLVPDRTRQVHETAAARPNLLAHWPPWDPEISRALDLERFHEWIVSLDPPIGWVTIEELGELWKSPQSINDDERLELRRAVYEQHQPFFVPDPKRPYILHVTPPENLEAAETAQLRMPVDRAAGAVREIFLESSGLKRFGFFPEQGQLYLKFEFPRAVRRNQVQRLAELQARTGWEIDLDDETQESDLLRQLSKSLELAPLPETEICHETGTVRIDLPAHRDFPDLEERSARFWRRTGYRIAPDRVRSWID